MTRLELFKSYKTHAVLGKGYAKLTQDNLADCMEFILVYDYLNKSEFEIKVNRWLLDQAKPANYNIMCELVICCNSGFERVIEKQ